MNTFIYLIILLMGFFLFHTMILESFQPYNKLTFPMSNSNLYNDESNIIITMLSNLFGINNPFDSIIFQIYPWYSKLPFSTIFIDKIQRLFNTQFSDYDIKVNNNLENVLYFYNLEKDIIIFKFNISGSSKVKSFTRLFTVTLELNNASKYFDNDLNLLNVFPVSFNDVSVKYIQLSLPLYPPSPNPFDPPIGDTDYKKYYRINNILGLMSPFYTSKTDMDFPKIQ